VAKDNPNPPQRGMALVWTLRSSGSSNIPKYLADLIKTGINKTLMTVDKAKLKNNSIISVQ
jgi:hypothetical protein